MDSEEGEQNDEHDDDDDDDAEEEEENRRRRKKHKTKSELYETFKGIGPQRMFAELVRDPVLKLDVRIICETAQPVERQYAEDIQSQKKNPARLQWISERSFGTRWWGETVRDTLGKVHDFSVHRRLQLTGPCNADPVELWLQDEQHTVEKLANFAAVLASNIAWSQLLFIYSLPHGAAGLLFLGCDLL